jgi:ferric-dicitrate binding protein FerR (iron transport regulator)
LEASHEKAQYQREENQKKGIKDDLATQAIDNVMYLRQTKQFYADLERMVRWEMGQPDLWREIVEEYQRLLDAKSEQAARELHEKRVKAWRRQRLKNQILDRALETAAVAFVVAYLICLMWIINLNHQGRLDTFWS